ncbi:MAG TPA: hypothetical protein VG709_05620 [Actinomycetota bacterium]|nr:hypothetical protein [Actinomycetota bacterium]
MSTLRAVEWEAHVERGRGRYEDGARRLPSNDPEARQKQLVRMAMAASAVGLALSMQGRPEATEWLSRSADRYRESFAGAPAGSWGRLIGALKARLLAGDRDGARADAAWALEQGPATSESPIGRYAAALAALVLGDDETAGALASSLRAEPAEAFPRPVADALAALAARDGEAYAKAAKDTLTSFETRDDYLEDLPVADTVLALELLAEARGIRAGLRSSLLPA